MLRVLGLLLVLLAAGAAQNASQWPLYPECLPNCSFFESVPLGAGTVLVVAGAAICSGAGIGGGGVFVPTFILALGLNAHWALPLSQVTIFGVGIGSLIYLLPQRHPTLPRRLIDLNLAALLEPATLAGTIPGVYLNVMFPAYLITILLAILLGLTAATTLRTGLQQRRVEQAAAASSSSSSSSGSAAACKEAARGRGQEAAPLLVNTSQEDKGPAGEKEDAGVVGSEAAHDGVWHWQQLAGLLVCGAVLAAASVAKSYFDCRGPYYWLFVVSPLPVIGFFAVYFARQPPKRGQHAWVWSAAGFVAGLAAGFLGIGGGMVKSPLMIYMRTTPQVATATASFMILFTAAGTALQFLLLQRLVWQYALWYGCAGLLGSLCGQFALARVIRYFGKQSLVSFFVAIVIGGCTVALVATNVIEMTVGHANMAFSGPCAPP